MKPITKILLIFIFMASASFVAEAQDPHFTVNWTSYCEVQSHDSYYKIDWALVYIPTQTVVRSGSETKPLSVNTTTPSIPDWDCDKDEVAQNYMWVVSVKRYQDDNITVTCFGQARSSYLRCSDLYDGVTLTVNMTYP